jgi:predicted  nucleic acid-binding Zn-ribbon protein
MIKALLAYQEADANLRKIETALSSSEERKKAMSAKKYLEGVEESVNKLDVRAAELFATYEKATDEQIKLKEQESAITDALDAVEDEKEAAYLIKKAEELIAKIKALGSKANKISEEIQAVIKEYSNIKKTTQAAQVQYKENAEKYNALKESMKEEKEKVEKELEALKGKVDPMLMDRYMKKRANKIYPILFEVKGNVCGACRMELPMSEMNKLKNGEVIDCDQCGRLLYLGE